MESTGLEPREGRNQNTDHARAVGKDDLLIESFLRRRKALVRVASRLIRRHSVDEADLDGESAVDLAFFDVYREFQRKGHTAVTDGELFGWVYARVYMTVLGSFRRSKSFKRGGEGRRRARGPTADKACASPSGLERVDADLDEFLGSEPPVEETVAARLDLRAFVARLSDPRHQVIITMVMEGKSIGDIANRLQLSRDTIQRRMDDIGRLFLRFFQIPDSAQGNSS